MQVHAGSMINISWSLGAWLNGNWSWRNSLKCHVLDIKCIQPAFMSNNTLKIPSAWKFNLIPVYRGPITTLIRMEELYLRRTHPGQRAHQACQRWLPTTQRNQGPSRLHHLLHGHRENAKFSMKESFHTPPEPASNSRFIHSCFMTCRLPCGMP